MDIVIYGVMGLVGTEYSLNMLMGILLGLLWLLGVLPMVLALMLIDKLYG
ncbi:TPA: hypothetical protein ACKP1B_002322 [Serratia fonticola]